MASPIAPANSRLVTVTAKLATYCNKEIGVFTDTGDIAYIEIASYKVSTERTMRLSDSLPNRSPRMEPLRSETVPDQLKLPSGWRLTQWKYAGAVN
jgi:hypothetical protein